MLQQLIPLLVLAGIFSFYGIAQAAKAYWEQSLLDTAEDHFEDVEEMIINITPTETPFSGLFKKDKNDDIN